MKVRSGLDYISTTYGVPATRGRRVIYRARLGTIVGARGPHVLVRLDGDKWALPYHPDDIGYDVSPWEPSHA